VNFVRCRAEGQASTIRAAGGFLALFLLIGLPVARAQSHPDFQVSRVSAPPVIDGDLSDEAWSGNPLDLGEWISYNPLRGEKVFFRTEVRIVYDDRNIYFAFHCFDDEPAKIRTTVSRRDSVFSDDWIALSLDSAGTGQTAYHLFVNPSGIQMDALNTASGERFEADLIWDSVGKIVDDGYVVEVKLPLQTIRFSGGDGVRMGLVFFRRISRTGISASWPEMPPGQWVFDTPAHVVFTNLKQPRLIEILPSITYGISQTRIAPDRWDDAARKGDVGLSAKYGITSNITLDATINPDFSQVESDAFQVEINQRFPIFYSEKRPFFMEGMGLFDIAGTGYDGNMRTAVHTRRIIDPSWGGKVTGTAGRVTFGFLNAGDGSPQDIGDQGAAIAGRRKLFTVGRATYSLGQSDYIGAIMVDTEHAGRHNRVIGGDLSVRFSPHQSFSTTLLASETSLGSSSIQGTASQVAYSYNSRRFAWMNQVEHYGRDFQMDTAFFNRTGFTSGWSYGEVNFYPKEGSSFWLKRVNPFYFTKQGRDRVQDGNERFLNTGIRFHFTRQGYLDIAHSRGREPWLGRQFKTGGGINTFGRAQILRWLEINGGFDKNREIYYDPVDPFQGSSVSNSLGITLQPNRHFSQNIEYEAVRFSRASNGERVFTVNIVNLRTTYQFNRHFLARLIEQYDSARHRLLTDLLGSYEFAPGTVFHAGYGSLYEKRDFVAGRLLPNGGDYLTVSRGLFFKTSYLHRF
jgi:uncharacterized protein DUF5916/cellulose/xylan binding protein with CBM9 domain